MGLFDELVNTGASRMAAGGQPHMSLATGILEMFNSQQGGGLQGLVQSFAQKGLGDIASSWVSTGPNLPVSGSQVQHALGSDVISALAQKAGIAPDAASSMLAQLLPGMVDKLTPGGNIPQGGGLLEQGLNILREMKF